MTASSWDRGEKVAGASRRASGGGAALASSGGPGVGVDGAAVNPTTLEHGAPVSGPHLDSAAEPRDVAVGSSRSGNAGGSSSPSCTDDADASEPIGAMKAAESGIRETIAVSAATAVGNDLTRPSADNNRTATSDGDLRVDDTCCGGSGSGSGSGSSSGGADVVPPPAKSARISLANDEAVHTRPTSAPVQSPELGECIGVTSYRGIFTEAELLEIEVIEAPTIRPSPAPHTPTRAP